MKGEWGEEGGGVRTQYYQAGPNNLYEAQCSIEFKTTSLKMAESSQGSAGDAIQTNEYAP